MKTYRNAVKDPICPLDPQTVGQILALIQGCYLTTAQSILIFVAGLWYLWDTVMVLLLLAMCRSLLHSEITYLI